MARNRFFSGIFLLSAIAALLILSGCAFGGGRAPDPRAGLKTSSYTATDNLIQQSRTVVTHETAIQAGPLTDIDRPSEQTAFGQIIIQQVSARLVQLGYNVTASLAPPGAMPMSGGDMMAAGDSGYGAPPSSYGAMAAPASLTLMGQYAHGKKEVFVNLRFVEAQTGRILAATDYTIPYDRDIKELMRSSVDKNSSFFGF